jgi:hypothetical protein
MLKKNRKRPSAQQVLDSVKALPSDQTLALIHSFGLNEYRDHGAAIVHGVMKNLAVEDAKRLGPEDIGDRFLHSFACLPGFIISASLGSTPRCQYTMHLLLERFGRGNTEELKSVGDLGQYLAVTFPDLLDTEYGMPFNYDDFFINTVEDEEATANRERQVARLLVAGLSPK